MIMNLMMSIMKMCTLKVTMVIVFFSAHAESLTSHYLHLPSTEIPFPHDYTFGFRIKWTILKS